MVRVLAIWTRRGQRRIGSGDMSGFYLVIALAVEWVAVIGFPDKYVGELRTVMYQVAKLVDLGGRG